MKNRNLVIITILSLFACIIHGLMLHTPFNSYALTSLVKFILFILCPIIYFRLSGEGKLSEILSIKGNKKSIRQSFILGGIIFVLVFIGFLIMNPWLDREMIVETMSNVGIRRENYAFAFLYYVIVNVALEEVFFRGFVFFTLYKMNQKRYAYIYSSVLFAIYHVAVIRDGVYPIVLVLSVIGLVVVGLLFNEITRKCENIIGSITVHASASLAISLIGLYIIL